MCYTQNTITLKHLPFNQDLPLLKITGDESITMRGGKRKGAGRKAGSTAKKTRRKDTITLFQEDWDRLDAIGPSRGKAVEKLLRAYVR